MPNDTFSATTRKISAEADAAIIKLEREHARDFRLIPADQRFTARFLMRMAYYEGRGDGAQFVADAVNREGE